MTDELERSWKEIVVAYSKYYPDIFLVGLRKTTNNLTQGSQYQV
jgi:hypothetical protein